MSDDPTIKRMVLSHQVKGRLLQAILEGRYPPGARIVETRVAREFGTSQAPVREALRDLEALGVVETTAFRGARVRRPTARQLLEAFEVRSLLETFAARLALPRLMDGDLDQLQAFLDEMRRAAADVDPYAEAIADAAFHGLIVRSSGNATLERVWSTLEPFLRTYITIVAPGIDRRAAAERHAPVLDALRARDDQATVSALERHFEQASAALASRWQDVPVDDRQDDAQSNGQDVDQAGSIQRSA